MPCTKDLAKTLSDLDAVKYADIVERAANNGYHDFKYDRIKDHPEYADTLCPKFQLVQDLQKFPELQWIVNAVIMGEYDEQADEEDNKMMREWLLSEYVEDSFFEIFDLPPPTPSERHAYSKKHFSNN